MSDGGVLVVLFILIIVGYFAVRGFIKWCARLFAKEFLREKKEFEMREEVKLK